MAINFPLSPSVGQTFTVGSVTYTWDGSKWYTNIAAITETDPIYIASSWYSTTNNSTNWNTAHSWGNHASAGYLTSSTAATTYQPLDGDLTAIGALAGTTGLLRKTALNTWSLDTASYLTGNQTITLSGDASGSGSTAIALTLANSGVTAGTYRSVTVDAKGRVTAGTNPLVLSGDSTSTQNGYFGDIYLYDDVSPSHYLQITNSANLTAARLLSINVNDADRTISLSGNLTVSSASTISGTNTGDQTITLTGDVTGSGTGSFTTTLANSGVTAGTYRSVTVDAKGRVTAGTNPTTLSGYGITDAQPLDADLTAIAGLSGTTGLLRKTATDTWSLDTNTYLTTNQTINVTGDASGSGSTSITVTLANSGVTAGTYRSVTVDAKGRVTAGTNPTTLSGYGITDAQPLDADLTAIAGLAGTSGLLKKTAADTWTLDTNTYLTSYTETDPVFSAHPAASVTNQNITNWNAAYGWGNHASAGYLTSSSIGTTVQGYSANLAGWSALATSSKQDTLVSGTNIKTINSTSLLGSGNISLVSGTVTISVVAALPGSPDANTIYFVTG